MTVRLPASDPRRARATDPRSSGPCIDGFGTCVSIVVLIAAATAALVVRQNLDDHVYSVAAASPPVETTGSR